MVSSRGTGPGQASEDDPFLQQSQSIPLTARERQEGYDVDLVHSQPRGHHALPLPLAPDHLDNTLDDLDGQPQPGYFRHSPVGHSGAYDQAEEGAAGAGLGAGGGVSAYGHAHALPDEKYSSSRLPRALDADAPRRRKWYLRPTALGALIGLVLLILALAVGLGVGLSKKHSKAVSADDSSSSSSSTTSRNRIPSSVQAAPSSPSPSSTNQRTTTTTNSLPSNPTAPTTPSPSPVVTSGATATASLAAAGLETGTDVRPTITTLAVATTRASTGNLPVPADSETTIGSVVYESVSVRRRWRLRR
ncbi:hypothetical protein RQP46_005722 [Phenoliferia psychrophenolica]